MGSVELLVTNEDKCFKIQSVSDVRVVVEEIPELKCDHEEAGRRMFVHVQHTGESVEAVVKKSPNTDAFVVTLATQPNINAKLNFNTGTEANKEE